MRLRRKPWARPELAACDFFVEEPETMRNCWQQQFGNTNPMQLELGCGKGGFIAQLGLANPKVNYLAIDLKSEVLALAKRKVEQLYTAHNCAPPANLRLMSQDIERLDAILGQEDCIQRIYINFCNPWPKDRHAKHRLTHTRQLLLYKKFLQPGGELWFKTDDEALFDASIGYFAEAGYTVRYLTRDLHANCPPDNVMTEHEQMFLEQGVPIKFLIAVNHSL
ncbi:MAG: tRNA (guanosine(46)-N7)-methyltransferase TrmB [Angelakisella sp.]